MEKKMEASVPFWVLGFRGREGLECRCHYVGIPGIHSDLPFLLTTGELGSKTRV